MFTVKHQLAEDFGTHITSLPDNITVKRSYESGFHAALRDSPKAKSAKAVISYMHPVKGVSHIAIDKGDKCWIMNANGKTVASI